MKMKTKTKTGGHREADRITINYNRGRCTCPKCSGQIMYDGTARDRLPLGFGFRAGRFVIDCIERKGFVGECLECFTKIFAVQTQRHVVKRPKLKGGRS
jgi:hypothetical protein